jgi:phosphomethylpyrimidine synthase
MEITQQVRDYAAKKRLEEAVALKEGLEEKSREFRSKGGELYS